MPELFKVSPEALQVLTEYANTIQKPASEILDWILKKAARAERDARLTIHHWHLPTGQAVVSVHDTGNTISLLTEPQAAELRTALEPGGRETLEMNPREIIKRNLHGMYDPSRRYPRTLPPEMAQWYVYTLDGGHSILVALGHLHSPGMSREAVRKIMVPMSVRTLQRIGYRRDGGFLIVDVPVVDDVDPSDSTRLPAYDHSLGLVEADEDYEY